MSSKDLRDKRNKDLLERMRRGESLARTNLLESWFPKRPTIKKNKDALDFIHSKKDSKK